MKAAKVAAVDIFCGAGGLTYGLRKAGIEVIRGIDIDESVRETYTRNNRRVEFLNKDVRKLNPRELVRGIDRSKKLFLLAGCAPCQPFSSQNRTKCRRDPRRSLIRYFTRLVEKTLPDYVLVENVQGFINSSNPYQNELVSVLRKKGYKYSERIVHAEEYGVPQHRHRYMLLASRLGEIQFPEPRYGPATGVDYKTVRDAIRKYPSIEAGQAYGNIPNHKSRKLSELNLKRIKLVPKNGGSRYALPETLQLKCHKWHDGHSDSYGRMCWDKPAPTLTCKCNSLSNGRFGHPTQNRAISLREAAALQTFPDSYAFYGSDTAIAKHIGNAVPVLLATKIGKVIANDSRAKIHELPYLSDIPAEKEDS